MKSAFTNIYTSFKVFHSKLYTYIFSKDIYFFYFFSKRGDDACTLLFSSATWNQPLPDKGNLPRMTLGFLDGVVGRGFANIQARNRVLSTNPPVAPENITSHGSSWLWAVTAIHSLLFIVVLALTVKTRHRQRVYHYIALALLLIPTIAYFTMASNLGAARVPVEFRRGGAREVFWVRYVGEYIYIYIIISLVCGVFLNILVV